MGRDRGAAVGMVLAAAASLQVGAAFAVRLFDDVGPGGAVFLRLALAAAVLVALELPEPHEHPRWPWTIAVEPLLVVPVLDAAPPVEAIGVAARSMSQQSHIRITEDHYRRALEAIASVASIGA